MFYLYWQYEVALNMKINQINAINITQHRLPQPSNLEKTYNTYNFILHRPSTPVITNIFKK